MNTQKIISQLKGDLSRIQTGRATPSLVEDMPVEYYDSQVTLKEVASISSPDSQTILINPWDKEAITNIEKALQERNFSCQSNGQVVRVSLTPPSQEKREELKKEIGQKAEEARIKVRQLRDEEREDIKEIEDEDEMYRQLDDLDEETEKVNQQIEEIKQGKIQQISG